jgi:hypothetical protein
LFKCYYGERCFSSFFAQFLYDHDVHIVMKSKRPSQHFILFYFILSSSWLSLFNLSWSLLMQGIKCIITFTRDHLGLFFSPFFHGFGCLSLLWRTNDIYI